MIDLQYYFEQKGKNYTDYLTIVQKEIEEEKPLSHYSVLNMKRMKRVTKTFKLSEAQLSELQSIKNNFKVIIISEGWCGDASQTVGVFNAIFEAMNVEVKYVFRDENPELMNQYTTNGAISIPIVVGFNQDGEQFRFGPRPQAGMELLQKHKAEPEAYPKSEFSIDLQKFYNKDKGQSTYSELVEAMKK